MEPAKEPAEEPPAATPLPGGEAAGGEGALATMSSSSKEVGEEEQQKQVAEGGQDGLKGESEPLIKKEEAGNAANASDATNVWGWGGWASVVSVLQEAQKTAASAASGVLEQLDAEARKIEAEAKGHSESAKGSKDDRGSENMSGTERAQGDPPEQQNDVGNNEEAQTSDSQSLQNRDEEKGEAVDGSRKVEDPTKNSVLEQSLKSLDESVETMASGALQALGTAWRGGLTFMHTLEESAGTLAHSIQEGTNPSILQSGRGFAERGLRVLEYVSQETINVIAQETGIKIEEEVEQQQMEPEIEEEEYSEEVTFERCFYIYGGPEHLEELEALSSHHTLLCTRGRAKLPTEEDRLAMDTLLEELQKILVVGVENAERGGGGEVDWPLRDALEEWHSMRKASIRTAMEMASGFPAGLSGLPPKEMSQRTTERLEAIRTESCHRVAEVAAACVALLLEAGKSLVAGEAVSATAEEEQNESSESGGSWPDGCKAKTELLRSQAQAMIRDLLLVIKSFSSVMNEVEAAYRAAAVSGEAPSGEVEEAAEGTVGQKSAALKEEITADEQEAVRHIQEGLKHLVYVLLSSSLKS